MMSFLAGQAPPERTGESDIPPVTKFDTLYQNINNMLLKTDTLGLEGLAITKATKMFDDSAVLSDENIQSFNKQVPGLDIPSGTREDMAKVLTKLQIQKNLASSIAAAPESDSLVGGLGKTIGFVGEQLDPVDTIATLPVAGVVGKGADLVGRALLPEAVSSLKFLPEALQPYVGAGIDGSVFGGSLGAVSGEIQSRRREIETGQKTPTSDIVKESIAGIPFGFLGGAAAYGLGSVIGKGLGLGTKAIEKGSGEDVVQAEQTGQSQANLQQSLEKRQKEIQEDRGELQQKVSQIRENQRDAANAHVPNGDKLVRDMGDNYNEIIDKAQRTDLEDTSLDRIREENATIQSSNEPHNIKAQALTQVNENLRSYSATNPDVIDEELKGSTDALNNYFAKAATANVNPDPDSVENILNNFRMTTGEDHVNMTKTAIAQMEQGRDIQIEPYINDAVARNSEKLVDRLEGAGIDRTKTLHSTLDSLDVVKEDQEKIQNQINELQDKVKAQDDAGKKNELRGQLAGLNDLLRTKTDQRAVHEVLAAALSNEFKQTPQFAVKSYLMNQLSKDADFKGGYQKLEDELKGPDLEELKERPRAITDEGKDEEKVIKQKTALSKNMVEDAYNCLLGR